MFPITPVELHEGYIIGQERIVTNRSGLFGWGDDSRHEVHVFDDQGREVPELQGRHGGPRRLDVHRTAPARGLQRGDRAAMTHVEEANRRLIMIRLRRLCGLFLFPIACLPAWGLEKESSPGLRSGVLMGMRIETITQDGDGARVVTTGAEFILERTGRIRCFQRIPARRQVAQIEIPPGTPPLKLERRNDFACIFSTKGISLTLQGDSLAIIRADQDVKLGVTGLFKAAYQAEKQGKWLFIDGQGGFGIYPTGVKKTNRPDVQQDAWEIAYAMRKGEEIWISVFPPRPYNWKRACEDLMAHEGSETPFTYPSTALIQSAARYCKVMVVHSWLWPGGDREPWKIPAFVPKDRQQFDRVRDDLHRAGMKMVPYFSPYYYSGKDFFAEVRRVLEEYKVDGLYFDGVTMDFRTSYEIVRKTRQMLGDDRILFRHCTSDPLASLRIYCPFIDTYCDYIYLWGVRPSRLGTGRLPPLDAERLQHQQRGGVLGLHRIDRQAGLRAASSHPRAHRCRAAARGAASPDGDRVRIPSGLETQRRPS